MRVVLSKFFGGEISSLLYEIALWRTAPPTQSLLTLKLPERGQMALPLNLSAKNLPNADFFLEF